MTTDSGVASIQVRRGAYYDSVVLMQLQRALAALEGVLDAGVVMGTPANKEILAQSDLLDDVAQAAAAEDLVIAVRARTQEDADAAHAQVDSLLKRRASASDVGDYLPRTLRAAAALLPNAGWVLVSTPGRYAAGVARDALSLGKHVFLYSDNVSVDDERALKREAAAHGLLLMGPDCGTAIVDGVGLGFANRVRRGPCGLIGASGTGLQYVAARLHQLGSGITHALGTGGRDLGEAVGATTTLQALDLLARDDDTRVIVLISKPPAPAVAAEVIRRARLTGKPVVVCFLGLPATGDAADSVHFVRTLDECAETAARLAARLATQHADDQSHPVTSSGDARHKGQHGGWLRGLYSGGTLAYEAQILLAETLTPLYSNAPVAGAQKLDSGSHSRGHAIVDLGEDEFTVGRLHPMLDNDLRIKRLLQEAADPEVAVLLLDVVLGEGAHPQPAAELGPAIVEARRIAANDGRDLPVVVVLVGTDDDPQNVEAQKELLLVAGAEVHLEHTPALRRAASLAVTESAPPVPLSALRGPLAALNVGLVSFAESLQHQGAPVQHVDWRPPAGGNDRLAGILHRMKKI